MKKILAFSFGVALLAAGAFAAGEHGDHMRMHGMAMGQGHLEHMAKALDLTAEQKTAVDKLAQTLKTKSQPLFEQHRQKMEAVETMLEANNPDPAQVGEAVIATHAVLQQIRSLHDDFKTQVRALLTPDQAAKFDQMKLRHHGPMFRGGPPPEDDGQ